MTRMALRSIQIRCQKHKAAQDTRVYAGRLREQAQNQRKSCEEFSRSFFFCYGGDRLFKSLFYHCF